VSPLPLILTFSLIWGETIFGSGFDENSGFWVEEYPLEVVDVETTNAGSGKVRQVAHFKIS